MLSAREEFLSFTKIPELNITESSINELVTAVVSVSEDRLGNQGIEIRKNFARNISPIFRDTLLISETLQRLIDNASGSMKSGGMITIETGNDLEKRTVYVKIIDEGKGISDNYASKIFQPYFTSKKGHKGLGLTLGRRVAELHHGLLNIETSSEGTTAVLIIPVTQELNIL